jgi:endonuclease III
MYRASQRLDAQLPATVDAMQQAHLLLQRHGQTPCRNASPRCAECPLARTCAHARRLSERRPLANK